MATEGLIKVKFDYTTIDGKKMNNKTMHYLLVAVEENDLQNDLVIKSPLSQIMRAPLFLEDEKNYDNTIDLLI